MPDDHAKPTALYAFRDSFGEDEHLRKQSENCAEGSVGKRLFFPSLLSRIVFVFVQNIKILPLSLSCFYVACESIIAPSKKTVNTFNEFFYRESQNVYHIVHIA